MEQRPRSTKDARPAEASLPPPPDLRVTQLNLGGTRYLVISHELPADSAKAIEADPDAESLLTPAEREVAVLAARGLSNQEIAKARRASASTIANQLGSIYRKLGVSSRLELMVHLSS